MVQKFLAGEELLHTRSDIFELLPHSDISCATLGQTRPSLDVCILPEYQRDISAADTHTESHECNFVSSSDCSRLP